MLHAENATYPWYPASVTKLMTAYVTLKAVKARPALARHAAHRVAERASAQAPSKMGFKAGSQVTVDNALKMLMVKSANDMAGGARRRRRPARSTAFADEMNRAAARLGMTQTS